MNGRPVEEDVFQINGNVYMTNRILSPFLCQRYPQHIFVFGDNYARRGKGGQAIIRDEPNTYGIVTKHYPDNGPNAYFKDNDPRDKMLLVASLEGIEELLTNKSIVLSSQGYGNGYAKLPILAPLLFQYLCNKLNELCGKVIYR